MFLISLTMRSSVSTNSCVEDFSSCARRRGRGKPGQKSGRQEGRGSGRTYETVVGFEESFLERVRVEIGLGRARSHLGLESGLPRFDRRKQVLLHCGARSGAPYIQHAGNDGPSSRATPLETFSVKSGPTKLCERGTRRRTTGRRRASAGRANWASFPANWRRIKIAHAGSFSPPFAIPR